MIDVAESLCIQRFMLSKWRKQAREGLIVTRGVEEDKTVEAELKEFRKVKKAYDQLKVERELLKETIAFTSARKRTPLPSSSTAKASVRSK